MGRVVRVKLGRHARHVWGYARGRRRIASADSVGIRGGRHRARSTRSRSVHGRSDTMIRTVVDKMPACGTSLLVGRIARMCKRIRVCALTVVGLMFSPLVPAAQYEILDRIPGPSWVAAWDYAEIDPRARHLYLAVLGSENGVIRLDLRSHRVDKWVSVKMPHGVAFVGHGLAAVADAATNSVVFAEEASGKVVGSVETGKPPQADGWHNPDSLLIEPKTGLLVAVNKDSGALALVDVGKRMLVGTVQIGGSLEAAAATGNGTVYVNVADKATIAAVDVPARRVIREFALSHCEDPSGIAYDSSDDLAISVCSNGLAKFVAPGTGLEVASLPVARGADNVIYDSRRKVVLIPGGDDGKLSVVRVGGRKDIRVIQALTTQLGTRLGAIDPTTGKVYLPTAKADLAAAPLRFPGLPPIPPAAAGSFEFLVVGIEP